MGLVDRFRGWFKSKKSKPRVPPDDLETEQEYKERWRSIYIIYFTMFLISLGFSIIVTGVWPYLDELDPTAGKEFMGYIVAANPLAQMLFSPLLGWWSNKLGSVRMPVLLSLLIFTVSSAIYSSLELLPSYRKHWMLWTRFLVGASSASVAPCRAYLSAATRFSERTKAVSMISLAQTLGFVFGPALQAAVVPLGQQGVWVIPQRLRLNMYTAAGWINVLFSICNVYLFLPSMFKEHKIAAREAMLKQGKEKEEDTWKQHKPDYFATWTLLVSFFVLVFNFMLLETLGTPVIMDQFAWSKGESLKYMGILMSVGAILAIATFAGLAPLSKMFSEVKIMIWGGFLLMVIGRAIYIPWGSEPPAVYDSGEKLNVTAQCDHHLKFLQGFNLTLEGENSYFLFNNDVVLDRNNGSAFVAEVLNLGEGQHSRLNESMESALELCGREFLGCPSDQKWCSYTPAMTVTQFMLGYVLTVFGYPTAVTLIQTIFSKILGPRPQGVWMGLLTGSGCLSRVLGPVFVTYIYTEYGTIVTFGLTTFMMVACLGWLLVFNKRLVAQEVVVVNGLENGQELKDVAAFENVPLRDDVDDGK